MTRQLPRLDAISTDLLREAHDNRGNESSAGAAWPFSQFELVADTPGGPGRLRDVVLQLALQGRLVEQRREEVHSSWVKTAAATAEVPFSIPASWTSIPLEAAATLTIGKTPSTREHAYWATAEGGIPWVSIGDMPHRGSIVGTTKRITTLAVDEVFRNRVVPAGTLLMSFKLTIGKVAFLACDALHNEAIASIVPHDAGTARYLFWMLPVLARLGTTKAAIMGATLNRESLGAVPIPLPPLAEQQRIVARVEELMALCDELEAKQAKMRDTGARLTKSALDALTTAERPDEFEAAWHRVVENFDVLIDGAEKIGELRQAILATAIRGALCRPADLRAPAEEMRRTLERERFQTRGLASRTNAPTSTPYSLPESWVWARLDTLCCAITDGDHQPPPKSSSGVPFLTIGNMSTGALSFSGTRFVSDEYLRGLDALRVPRRGDVLYTVVGSFGIPIEVDTDRAFCVQRHVAILRPLPSVETRFLRHLMASGLVYRQARLAATGIAQPTVGLGSLRNFVVPIPPVADQRRIITKVDGLMTLCDQLEASLRQAEERASRLAATTVSVLLS